MIYVVDSLMSLVVNCLLLPHSPRIDVRERAIAAETWGRCLRLPEAATAILPSRVPETVKHLEPRYNRAF